MLDPIDFDFHICSCALVVCIHLYIYFLISKSFILQVLEEKNIICFFHYTIYFMVLKNYMISNKRSIHHVFKFINFKIFQKNDIYCILKKYISNIFLMLKKIYIDNILECCLYIIKCY